MGERPEGKSIGRIDNNGNYCKENCRWETNYQQSRNRRTNVYLTFRGKRCILSDLAKKAHISKSALRKRLLLGWSVEKALTEPIDKTRWHKSKTKKKNNN